MIDEPAVLEEDEEPLPDEDELPSRPMFEDDDEDSFEPPMDDDDWGENEEIPFNDEDEP